MNNGRLRVLVGSLILLAVLASSAPGILGFPGGAGDGNRTPSSCNGCHGNTGSGTVTVSAPATTVLVSEGMNITVTVTETAAGGKVGVFLLKGPSGTAESITADGWTVARDPNGGTSNYIERSGLPAGEPTGLVWALAAPASPGTYSIWAQAVHAEDGAANERASDISVEVVPVPAGTDPPIVWPVSLPASVPTGSAVNITARITDDSEGVASASLFWKAPGGAGFSEKAMALLSGDSLDGRWSAEIPAGGSAGALELYITATDGIKTSRSPGSGTYAVAVAAPGVPEISAPILPATAETNSAFNVSARMTDSDGGVVLAVLRYRLPGAEDLAAVPMSLVNGSAADGNWTAEVGTGPAPGELELRLEATDGEHDALSPAAGYHTVRVVKPPGPAIEVGAPSSMMYGASAEIRARITDSDGVMGAGLHFRMASEAAFRTLDMALRNGTARNGEYYALLPAANSTGEYILFVAARNARSDNRSADIAVKVLPDIYISDLKVSRKGILVKQEVQITATIRNIGDKPISGVAVRFLDLGYHIGYMQDIRILDNVTVPANGDVRVSARWVPQVEGVRELRVVADPDNRVSEGNETNNERGLSVPVRLESAVGVKTYVPKLSDIWVQLAVTLAIAAIAIGLIARGALGPRKRRPSGDEGQKGDAPPGNAGGGG